MSKTLIYLIRHGEAEGNITKRSHGITDTDLTVKGRNQVELLRNRFKDIPFDCIYSSDLKRAINTAKGLAIDKGYELNTCSGLREANLGDFEDTSWYEIKNRFAEESKLWLEKRPNYPPPNGESYSVARERFFNAVLEIAKDNLGKTIVIVAHASVIKEFDCKINGPSKGYSENTAVSLYEYNGDFSCVFKNDFSHLPGVNDLFMVNADFNNNTIDAYSLEYLPTFNPNDIKDKETITGLQLKDEVGQIEYEIKDNQAFINSLFIFEDKRRKGYASQLIGEVIYRARHKNALIIIAKKTNINFSLEAEYLFKKNDFIKDDLGNYYKNIVFNIKR